MTEMKPANPQGKGSLPVLAELSALRRHLAEVPAKPVQQVANELFTALFVLEADFAFINASLDGGAELNAAIIGAAAADIARRGFDGGHELFSNFGNCLITIELVHFASPCRPCLALLPSDELIIGHFPPYGKRYLGHIFTVRRNI